MVFNKNINGYENENEFVRYFNNKKVYDFDLETVCFLENLYSKKLSNEKIKCWKVPGYTKVDIRIEINDSIKNISIKKGVKNEVHTETIQNMIEFLSVLGISLDTLSEIKKYLYADGTENGTGKQRQSISEYKEFNSLSIEKINKEINNEYIMNKIIERCIIKGRISDLEVDAIIYGVVDDFLWIKRDEIYEIIRSKINNISTAIHFGALTIQSWDRNLKMNPKYEYRRDYVQFKWYNIGDDIIETMALIRNKN